MAATHGLCCASWEGQDARPPASTRPTVDTPAPVVGTCWAARSGPSSRVVGYARSRWWSAGVACSSQDRQCRMADGWASTP